MFDLKSLFSGYPEIIQYLLAIGIVLIIIYVCLILCRLIGDKYGKSKVYYDDPIAYDKTIPSLFGNKLLHRKSKAQSGASEENKAESAEEKPAENTNEAE